ncbi:endonuclease/exonuclease/phosphatase family protein [Pedococcus sp. KACC 23699]|uniref:Endonuclease/exonuclease/phosphatase family protein n=1 Tax=Pedococcus sp. KACC 23699 TaxID=3149228 RepID=A0AAU7JR97_9MICO
MRLRLLTAALLGTVLAATLAAPAAQAAAPPTPGPISAVTATTGPGAGEVTLSWRQDGSNTTAFVIETGLTVFSSTDHSLPLHGRGSKTFTVAKSRRSVTLTAAQVASAGASLGSANHVFYRFRAVNQTTAGTSTRTWPYLQSFGVRPISAPTTGTLLRVATFNVHTATPMAGFPSWLSRVDKVSDTILSRNPGVVGLQELGITPADGSGPSMTAQTQAQSLVASLARKGAGRYKLVRTTRYVMPGSPSAVQGARILYDSSRYRLLSSCLDTTNGVAWSSSCTVRLRLLSGDSETARRRAGFAILQDRTTGTKFFVVAAHLDQRHSTSAATDAVYENLRAGQVADILGQVARSNPSALPVVLAGDLNTYQPNVGGYLAHDALVRAGYYDTASALTQVNLRYPTINKMACTLAIPMVGSFPGWGTRIDVVMVKGLRGAVRSENVLQRSDCARPSDHNLVVADVRLP